MPLLVALFSFSQHNEEGTPPSLCYLFFNATMRVSPPLALLFLFLNAKDVTSKATGSGDR